MTEQIGFWDKLPLIDKLILAALLVIPFSCYLAYRIAFATADLVTETDAFLATGLKAFLLPFAIIFVVVWLMHRKALSDIKYALKESVYGGECPSYDVFYYGRVEYLDGHPLLPGPQAIDLVIGRDELVLFSRRETFEIPINTIQRLEIQDMSDAFLPRDFVMATLGTLGSILDKLDTTRAKWQKVLSLEYIDKTGMPHRNRIGHVVPTWGSPSSLEAWRYHIMQHRSWILSGKKTYPM